MYGTSSIRIFFTNRTRGERELPNELCHLLHHLGRALVPDARCNVHPLDTLRSHIKLVYKLLRIRERHEGVVAAREHQYVLVVERVRRVRRGVRRARGVVARDVLAEAVRERGRGEGDARVFGAFGDELHVVRAGDDGHCEREARFCGRVLSSGGQVLGSWVGVPCMRAIQVACPPRLLPATSHCAIGLSLFGNR